MKHCPTLTLIPLCRRQRRENIDTLDDLRPRGIPMRLTSLVVHTYQPVYPYACTHFNRLFQYINGSDLNYSLNGEKANKIETIKNAFEKSRCTIHTPICVREVILYTYYQSFPTDFFNKGIFLAFHSFQLPPYSTPPPPP